MGERRAAWGGERRSGEMEMREEREDGEEGKMGRREEEGGEK